MFHRFVNHNGVQIDYDRASWLMDSAVFAEAKSALTEALGQSDFDQDVARKMHTHSQKPTEQQILQTLWDNYCAKHEVKYGVPFNPDVM